MDPQPFQPYQNPLYQAPSPWANANTFAPWAVPDGSHGTNYNPSFSGQGGTDVGPDWMGNPSSSDSTRGNIYSMDFNQSMNGLGWWDFKGGTKRSSPNFYAPSYQGQWFMPSEGLPQYFGTSMEGSASDSALQSAMMPQNSSGSQQNQSVTMQNASGSSGLGGDNSYAMPSYIGQTPWLGDTVGNYAPNIGSSYRGYSTYGGYGASGSSGSGQSNAYQPFVPTGYSRNGQY